MCLDLSLHDLPVFARDMVDWFYIQEADDIRISDLSAASTIPRHHS